MKTKKPRSPIKRVLSLGETKNLKRASAIVADVHMLEEDFAQLSDEELLATTAQLKEQFKNNHHSARVLMAESFTAVREAANRSMNKKHFDVQLIGGAVLASEQIAEMATGAGKSLTATLPSYLHVIMGHKVHVITVNDFLATEQSAQMSRLFERLGVSVGCITATMETADRQAAYACDITYGTSTEFGFDYLRDHGVFNPHERVQQSLDFAIVDEVDSVLIDDARTPLIISADVKSDHHLYIVGREITEELDKADNPEEPGDYTIDEIKKTIALTESGITHIEDLLGIENLYDEYGSFTLGYIENAIRAREFYKIDRDYIVTETTNEDKIREGITHEVELIDLGTGRVLEGRRFSEGLHQAIEAKEGVFVKTETLTTASITMQDYIKTYSMICGMTGTAMSEVHEFKRVFDLDVVAIPSHKPVIRIDKSDRLFINDESKTNAIINELLTLRDAEIKPPILIGTSSIAASEHLAHKIRDAGIPVSVLNAKYLASEASLIARAGEEGRVTIATNMAGRGTDIILGGNIEHQIQEKLSSTMDDVQNNDDNMSHYDALFNNEMDARHTSHQMRQQRVIKAGGLHVIGTERHISRRIDNQLRGRAGRQGDPGSSQFFISFDDTIFDENHVELEKKYSRRQNERGEIITKDIDEIVTKEQQIIETLFREQRKDMLKYAEIVSTQRSAIYALRDGILDDDPMYDHWNPRSIVNKAIKVTVRNTCTEDSHTIDNDQLDEMFEELKHIYPCVITKEWLVEKYGSVSALSSDILNKTIAQDAQRALDGLVFLAIEDEEDIANKFKTATLANIDIAWRNHLHDLDIIKDGIALRGYAGRDPVIEFNREADNMFNQMQTELPCMITNSFFGGDDEIIETRRQSRMPFLYDDNNHELDPEIKYWDLVKTRKNAVTIRREDQKVIRQTMKFVEQKSKMFSR